LIAAGLAGLVAFAFSQQRASLPLLRVQGLADRAIGGGFVMMLAATAVLFGSFLLSSLYLQQVLGANALTTGLAFLPFALALNVKGPFGVTVRSEDTPRPVTTFTLSADPSRIAPCMIDPGRKVRLSECDALKSIAVPPRPMMAPELSRVDGANAVMPVPPVMVPELITLAVVTKMPEPEGPPEMIPELATLAVVASMPVPEDPAEMVPELVTLAVKASMPRTSPEIVPELVTLAKVALMPTPEAPDEIVPELTTVAVPRVAMPSPKAALPDMIPEFVTLTLLKASMPTPPVMVPKLPTLAVLLAKTPKFVPVTVPKFVSVSVAASLMPVPPPETVVPAGLVQV